MVVISDPLFPFGRCFLRTDNSVAEEWNELEVARVDGPLFRILLKTFLARVDLESGPVNFLGQPHIDFDASLAIGDSMAVLVCHSRLLSGDHIVLSNPNWAKYAVRNFSARTDCVRREKTSAGSARK